MAYMIQPNHMM